MDEVSNGVCEAGGKPTEFLVSDTCDGVIQATAGVNYSLVSRDVMTAMAEIDALGHPHDAMVLVQRNVTFVRAGWRGASGAGPTIARTPPTVPR